MGVPRENYSDFVDFSSELINEFGREITIKRRSTDLIDPNKPWLGTQTTTTDHTVYGVFDTYVERNVPSSLVQAGDKRVFVPAKDLTIIPQLDDTVVDGSIENAIIFINTTSPGSADIIYELAIRA